MILVNLDAAKDDLRSGLVVLETHAHWEGLERVVDVLAQLWVLVQVGQVGSSLVLKFFLGFGFVMLFLVFDFLLG